MAAKKKIGLKITQASLNQTAWDFPRNLANIYAAIDEAVTQGSDILALEELAYNGYESNDDFQKTDNDRTYGHLKDIAAYAAALDPNLIISVGHSWRLNRRDVKAAAGLESERLKNPLYNRLDLPFNVQTMMTGGQVQAMTAKMYLYNDGRGFEKRYFAEWSMQAANEYGGIFGTIEATLPDNRKIPFGRPLLHFYDQARDLRMNVAQMICEEKWVATKWGGAPYSDDDYDRDGVAPAISRYAGSKEGLVAIIPNASPPSPLKMDKHVHLAKLASQYADIVIDTDGVGSSGSTFAQFGHRLIAQNGKLVSTGIRMSFNRVAANTTVARIYSAPAETLQNAHVLISHDFANAKRKPVSDVAFSNNPQQVWDNPAYEGRDKEEVVRMTALWLFDYMRKTKSQGVVEALSGGADSAFNSVLVAVMVRLAIKELGVDGFCSEMGHLKYSGDIRAAALTGGEEAAVQECMRHMLTTAYMGTNNSSDNTRNAARFLIEGGTAADGTIIEGIGGVHKERNVQDLLDFYAMIYAVRNTTEILPLRKSEMQAAIAAHLNQKSSDITLPELQKQAADLMTRYPEIGGRLLSAANPRDSVTYENLQARGRQAVIMMVANAEGKMAIANPNLDEARNAYATYGGDLHSGTINLNAHLPKAYQLEVMHYLHDVGLQGVMPPVRALGLVLKNKPSAELLPKDSAGNVVQSDEAALQRTFPQMARISRYMLHVKIKTPDGDRLMNAGELFQQCQIDPLFEGVRPNELFNMVRLSYARWGISQHKIHASPIAPTMDENVDHQTSRRTPNLSGQSLDELTSLGIEMIYSWAEADGVVLQGAERSLIEKRAAQDEEFIRIFDSKIWAGRENQTYDLHNLYQQIKTDGWDKFFPPLSDQHPVTILNARNRQPRPS